MLRVWVIGNHTSVEANYNDFVVHRGFVNEGADVAHFDFAKLTLNAKGKLLHDGVALPAAPDVAVFVQPIFTIPNTIAFQQRNDVIAKLKTFNTLFINDIDAHCNSANKSMMYGLLNKYSLETENVIPVPNTLLLEAGIEDSVVEEKVEVVGGYPVVLKDPLNTGGRGTFSCNNITELRAAELVMRERIKNTPILMQSYCVMSGKIIDVRVTGDSIKSRLVLIPADVDEFKGNISTERSYVAIKTDDTLRKIVLDTMQALSLDLARLDIFATNEGYKVCEANSIGSILGSETAWNADVGREIASYCIQKYTRLQG